MWRKWFYNRIAKGHYVGDCEGHRGPQTMAKCANILSVKFFPSPPAKKFTLCLPIITDNYKNNRWK